MSKQTKCWECWGLNGHHWTGCQRRGYANVGPHPDAPPREAAPASPGAGGGALEMCCGGTTVRAVCAYHGPSAALPERGDGATGPRTPVQVLKALRSGHRTGRHATCICQMCVALRSMPQPSKVAASDLRLLGPDDPEVSSDLIYATPDGGVVGVPQAAQLLRDAHVAQRRADAAALDTYYQVTGPGVFVHDADLKPVEAPIGSIVTFTGSAPAAGRVGPERWVVGLAYADGTFRPGAVFEPYYATQAEAVAARQVVADKTYVHTWLWDIRRVS
jgi:hypothetical protein